MPITVGPGSIAVAIALGSQRPREALTLTQFATLGGAAVAGIIAIAATIYVCYWFAEETVVAAPKIDYELRDLIRRMSKEKPPMESAADTRRTVN